MIHVAILEDEKKMAEILEAHLKRCEAEYGEKFKVDYFDNPVNFIELYKPVYDIVFMDIDMPLMNGLEAAERLREVDSSVVLVFVTNLIRYATEGYKVEALDFLVKPVEYYGFLLTLKRCLEKIGRKQSKELSFLSGGRFLRIRTADVVYFEIVGHNITVHTINGDYPVYGTLLEIEEQLRGESFARCNACYLVNLRYVERMDKFVVYVNGTPLSVSHAKKKKFAEALNEYYGRD